MSTTTGKVTAERLGRSLGRGWGAYRRCERRVLSWLVSKGVPVIGAAVLIWTLKLAALGVLLYAAIWLALLLVFLVFVAWGHCTVDEKALEPEWRHGNAGFGLYTQDGYRIDPHDPSDET